jgi:bla regulator protein BlaR1
MTLTDTLGWTLLHSLWQGAAVALLLAIALCVLRNSRTRYIVACCALALTLLAFVSTFIYFIPPHARIFSNAPNLSAAPTGAGAGFFGTPAHLKGSALPPWIALVWLAGLVVFQLRAFGGWLTASQLRRKGVSPAPHVWQHRLTELGAQFRIARPVAFFESTLAEVPVVIGHWKPVILIPAGLLAGLPAAQIETILLHELAHILRHDYLVNLLQTLAEGLLFYHPATWWIGRIIRAEREHCCDDLVVSTGGDPHEYAMALTSLASDPASIAMAATGGSVLTRVRRLLKQPEKQRTGLGLVLITSALVLGCAAGLAHAQEPRPSGSSFQKWLTDDVAYIIRAEERDAFQRLTTDEEREHFIEQFWLRRDPTPNTLLNEMKEEHYRRIGYTNLHYGGPC